jgi:predicted deacylase
MKHMGILGGEPEVPEKVLVFKKIHRIDPRQGGYLFPNVEPERLNKEIAEGELLGTVVSPYTFEVLERLVSPVCGMLYYTARRYPVRPGDWSFGVIDMTDPDTRWE